MVKLKSKHYQHYKGKVYDLSVKNKHTYNANGLAVHNSGAGSLVCYAIGITQVDPIKHGLLFERFLSRKKACLPPHTYVLAHDHRLVTHLDVKMLKDLEVGDMVYTHTKAWKPVVSKEETLHKTLIEFELEDGTMLTSSPNHLWIVIREGKEIEVRADEIRETDEFIKML